MTQRGNPPPPTIDLLLNLIDTRPDSILRSLADHPQLAHAADAHGYSLVHASASYAQLDVLRALINEYKVDVNKLDEDGETSLFACEKADIARVLVEELGADWNLRNSEGKTAEQRIQEDEGETEVVAYLRSLREGHPLSSSADLAAQVAAAQTAGVHPPPPLPNGVKVEVGTMAEDEVGEEPDPEIRRRIEELAQSEDFQTEEGQARLRQLVTEVVTGMGQDGGEDGRNVRRRVE